MSDDEEAVVMEVFEAESAALDELHFSMEAFGDAIIFWVNRHIQAMGSAHERRVLARVMSGLKRQASSRSMNSKS